MYAVALARGWRLLRVAPADGAVVAMATGRGLHRSTAAGAIVIAIAVAAVAAAAAAAVAVVAVTALGTLAAGSVLDVIKLRLLRGRPLAVDCCALFGHPVLSSAFTGLPPAAGRYQPARFAARVERRFLGRSRACSVGRGARARASAKLLAAAYATAGGQSSGECGCSRSEPWQCAHDLYRWHLAVVVRGHAAVVSRIAHREQYTMPCGCCGWGAWEHA